MAGRSYYLNTITVALDDTLLSLYDTFFIKLYDSNYVCGFLEFHSTSVFSKTDEHNQLFFLKSTKLKSEFEMQWCGFLNNLS